MGLKPWQEKMMKLSEVSFSCLLLQCFHVLATTILSLVLPLSFILLARISNAQFLKEQHQETSLLSSVFLYTNPTLLHPLVSIITLSSLIHTITGRISVNPEQPTRLKLASAWIFLFTLQVCVGFGIESSIIAGIDGSGFSKNTRTSFLTKALFFTGVHETMMYWCRSVVKPVVDDTVCGGSIDERWVERAVMTAGCGGLWWFRLRDEVDALIGVVEVKMDTSGGGVGVGDFVGWWLYYLLLTIGIARIFKGLLWVGMLMFFSSDASSIHNHGLVDDEHHV